MREYFVNAGARFNADVSRIWAGGPLQRIRLVSAAVLIAHAIFGMTLGWFVKVPVWFNLITIVLAGFNLVLVFWRMLHGISFPLLHLRHTKLTVDPGAHLAERTTDDGTWYYDKIAPEVDEWCRSHLSGRYGTVPLRDSYHGETYERTFWFANPNDAFAFKMRWAGL